MSDSNRVRLSRLSLALVVALAAAPAFAQSTSAGVGGRIVGADGQPVAGAEVTIVHTESGTVSKAVTDENGRYIARGLRVGGPYTITVNKAGAGTSSKENVYLGLNQAAEVDAQLNNGVATLGAVQVVGAAAASVFTPDKMGAGTTVTREQIEAAPSIGRNIQDLIRLDPRVAQTSKGRGEISAGGQNTRFNAIRIDGVSAADTFGLEANNMPTLRQPVSIDAIEAVTIDLSNYDTSITGGTGAVINAVTKSGTNNFDGAAYYVFRDNDWVRKGTSSDPDAAFDGFNSEKTFGGVFGGPLIKDKLFFFVNYEKFVREAPGTTISPLAARITDANITEAQRIARDVWGMDIGTSSIPSDLKTEVEEYAAKIDWNINDDHRLSFRYSNLDQVDAFLYGMGSSSRSLSSNWSNTEKNVESYVTHLFSDWSDVLSTEFKISRRDYDSVRQPFSRLPAIGVAFGTPRADGSGVSPFLNFGTDSFSHYNVLETQTWNYTGTANLYLNDHTVKFGFDLEDNEVYNLFGQSQFGTYNFASLAAFQAGEYYSYNSKAPRPGLPIDSIAAEYTHKNLGLFVQDTWTVTDQLTLMFGMRWDTPSIDTPEHNALVQAVYGYDNSATLDGSSLFQPRVGFNYNFASERPTQLRGGVGLFQGAAASVWIGNSFANTGINVIDYGTPSNFAALTPAQKAAFRAQYPFSPNPDRQPQPALGQQMAVNLMHPDFEQPSVWKANIAFDHELPWWGTVFSAEALFTKVETGIHYERLDLGAPTQTGPDGRQLFWANNVTGSGARANQNATLNAMRAAGQLPAGFSNISGWASDGVILLRPTDKGGSEQFTVSLTKPMLENWSWMAAYTFTDAEEVNPLTSSRAISNWNSRQVFQPNEEIASRSSYEVRHRALGVLNWSKAFFGDHKTQIGLVYEGRIGKPYSWTFRDDANGDGYTNDLLYVPVGPGDVIFRNAGQEAAFFEFLAQNPDLAKYRGQVVARNGANSEWAHNFDLRLSQDLPSFFDGHKAQVVVDVLNIGNLLNKDWGQVYEAGFPLSRGVVEYDGRDAATGKYKYNFDPALVGQEVLYDNQDQTKGVSRWQVQMTLRYEF